MNFTFLAKCIEWYQSKNQREQIVLAGLAIFLVIVFIFEFIMFPLEASLASLDENINENVHTVALLHQLNELQKAQKNIDNEHPISFSSGNLYTDIQDAFNQNGLTSAVVQLNQTGDKEVEIQFKKVPFDILTNVFIQLWYRGRIKVTSITISKGSVKGTVDGQAKLTQDVR